MRLLVTRPQEDAERTAELLRRQGHTVVVQPLLTIVFAAAPRDLPTPAALLLTSGNAVRAVMRWPQAAAWRGLTAFAIGPGTAALATTAGFTDVRQAGGDVAGLATTVAAALAPTDRPLLYPAARDRAGDLAGKLAGLGYRAVVVEAYRAESANALRGDVRSALAAGTIDGVLVYSRRTAEALLHLAVEASIEAAIRRLRYFALSEEVAAPLHAAGLRVQVAERPDEASLFALLPRVG